MRPDADERLSPVTGVRQQRLDVIDRVEVLRAIRLARSAGSSGQPVVPGRSGALIAFASSPGLARSFCVVVCGLCLWTPVPATAQTPTPAAIPVCTHDVCDLTLKDALGLALARNRPLLNSRLDREVRQFSLDVAEDRWLPRVTFGSFASRDRRDHRAGVGTRMRLRVPTGDSLALGWDEALSERLDGTSSQIFSFSQPLLKGAGAGIDSATVRQARLGERIDVLAFRRTGGGSGRIGR